MSDIHCGTKVTLTKWVVRVYWPTLGENADFRFASKVGTWIGKNEKVLGKSKATSIARLVEEQFGSVSTVLVEHRDNYGELAWLKG